MLPDWFATTVTTAHPVAIMPWWQRFWNAAPDNLLDSSVTVLILTAAARAGWALASAVWRAARFYLSPAVAQMPIEITGLGDVVRGRPNDVRLYCQIVRFGADDYIQNLASEQERYEGRLQNKVLPVPLVHRDDGYSGFLLLPVHRRLGTQFKMFLMCRSSTDAKALIASPFFSDEACGAHRRGRRISFLLSTVDPIRNTEGTISNNMLYPSNLHDFVEWNSYGRIYLAVQRWRFRWTTWRKSRQRRAGQE